MICSQTIRPSTVLKTASTGSLILGTSALLTLTGAYFQKSDHVPYVLLGSIGLCLMFVGAVLWAAASFVENREVYLMQQRESSYRERLLSSDSLL